MSDILLCHQPMMARMYSHIQGVEVGEIYDQCCSKPTVLAPFRPYALTPNFNERDSQTLSILSKFKAAQELTKLSLSFGADNVLAMAEMAKKLKDFNIGMMGASTSVYANRMTGFAKAVQEYQSALLDYRDVSRANKGNKVFAKQRAHHAYQRLQVRFKNELNMINAGIQSRRGTPLSNPNRGINIARSSRHVTKLQLSSLADAHNLVKFTQYAKFLGNGLAVIDFTSRAGRIHNTYQSGGHWEKELFIETSGFATSAIIGTAIVSTAPGALSLLMALTPVGWVGLVVGGVAIAGTAAVVTNLTNKMVSNKASNAYDTIVKWVSNK